MECEQIKELIDDYLDRTLAQAEGEALERHLAQCEACRAEFAFVRMLASDLSEGALEEVPQGLADKILERLPAGKFRIVLPWGLSIGEVAYAAAAILLAAFFSIFFAKYVPSDALSTTLNSFGTATEKLSTLGSSWNEHILALGQHPEYLIIIGILGLALWYAVWSDEDYEAPCSTTMTR